MMISKLICLRAFGLYLSFESEYNSTESCLIILGEITMTFILFSFQLWGLETLASDVITQGISYIFKNYVNDQSIIPSPLEAMLCILYILFLLLHLIDQGYQILAREELHRFKGKLRIFFCSLLNREVLVWFYCSLATKGIREPEQSAMNSVSGITTTFVICILILLLSPILGAISTFFNLTPFDLGGLFNSRMSILNILNYCSKLIAAFILSSTSLESMSLKLAIPILLLIFSLKFFILFYYYPIYNHTGMRIIAFFALTEFMISFGITFIYFFNMNIRTVLVLQILFYPIFIKICIQFVDWFTVNSLYSKEKKIEYRILRQFSSINHIAKCSSLNPHEEEKNICNIHLLYSLGLISVNLEAVEDSFTNNINRVIDIIYQPGLSTINSNFLKLSFIHRCLEQKINLLFGLKLIIGLQKSILDFKEQLLYYHLRNMFQQSFDSIHEDKHQEKIKIKPVIDFEKASNELCELLASNTQKYIDFWKLYREQEVQAVNLKIASSKMEDEAASIMKYMNKFESSYGIFAAKILPLYYLYLIAIRNAPYTGEKIQKSMGMLLLNRSQQISDEEKITKQNLAEKKNVFLYVSNAREKFGRIMSSTGNIYDQFGWNAGEIVGKHIEFLLPFSSHSSLVDMLGPEEINLQPEKIIFCKTKAGFIIPCSIMVSLYPYLEKEIIYVYTIRAWSNPFKTDFLIINRRGKIDAYSKKIARFLEFVKERNNYYIRDYCLGMGSESIGSKINVEPSINGDLLDFGLSTPKKTIDEISPLLLTSVRRELLTSDNTRGIGSSRSLKFETSWTPSPIDKKSPGILSRLKTVAGTPEKTRITLKNSKGIVKHYSFEVEYEIVGENRIAFLRLNELKQKNSKKVVKTINESAEFDQLEIPNETNGEPPKPARQAIQIIAEKPMPPISSKIFDLVDDGYDTALDISSDSEISSRVSDNLNHMDSKKKRENLLKKFAEIESQSVASIATRKSIKDKVENGIYSLPDHTALKAIFCFVLGYIILAMILLVLFQQNTKDKMEKVKANSLILRAASSRIFTLVEINSIGQIIRLLDRGLWKNDRYQDFGMPDLYEAIQAYSQPQALLLSELSNEIRSAISGVEPMLQEKFYSTEILIDGPGPNLSKKYGHMLDIDTLIIEECLKLYNQERDQLIEKNPQIQFLLNNILNELIIESENVIEIFLSDNKKKLDLNLKFVTLIFAIISSLAFIFVIVIILECKKLMKIRDSLLEVFLRLDNIKIDEAVKRAEDFLVSIKIKVNVEHKEVHRKKKFKKRTFYNLKQDNSVKKRLLNNSGINQNLYTAIGLILVWCCVFVLSYLFLYLTTQSTNATFQTSVERDVEINQFMVNLDMQVWIMEEYIGQNRSTYIRNQPIAKEMDKMYMDTISSQSFFLDLIGLIENDQERLYVKSLILGDLCPIRLDPTLPPELCSTIANGAPQSGIIGLIGYIMKFIKITKDFYDNSEHTKYDQEIAFSINLGNIAEMTTYMYLFPAYRALENLVYNQFSNHIESYPSELFKKLIIIFIIIMVIGTWLWVKVWKRLDKERIEWGSMTRMIPILMFFNNKALRNYIARYKNIKIEPMGYEESWT